MTLLEIFKEYDPAIKIEYGSNYYGDLRKKLLIAFECLGLYDLEIFKSDNGKDYYFHESSKEYIINLLKQETSPLFRNIKGNKMTIEDYVALSTEVDKLFDFIKPYTEDEDEYERIVSEISYNVNYPLIKRFANFQDTYHSFSTYFDSMVKNDGEVTEIINWEYLTCDDKVKLFDELITATKKWLKLVEALGEYRADEITDATFNLSIDDLQTWIIVEDAIAEEYCKMYDEQFQPSTTKSRSFRAQISKDKSRIDEVCKLKLDIAKKYCDTHDIDFKKYLEEKELVENSDFTPVSTDEAFKNITSEII